jgi:putative phosphoribosyl transferase
LHEKRLRRLADRKEPEYVKIPIDSMKLEGLLRVSDGFRSIVIFAHGSGSSRFSSRNNYVASVLWETGFSSLLFDLLTPEEDQVYENRFNIDLLARRLTGVTKWVLENVQTRSMRVGYFGASTGAAAALQAETTVRKNTIGAIVSRGGRPDMAIEYLPKVQAPTLLIVGERDREVIELNKLALEKLRATKELTIVPRATHLFEEPGTLEQVAKLATEWFSKFLK